MNDVNKTLEQAIENLNKLVESREKKIARLQKKLEDLKFEEEVRQEKMRSGTAWMAHIHHGKNDPWDSSGALPIPRLQMVCVDDDDADTRAWNYSLIYRHYSDDRIVEIPLGRTTSYGGCLTAPDTVVPEPYRESFHIRADSDAMKLPAFVIHEDRARKVSTLTQFKSDQLDRDKRCYSGPMIKLEPPKDEA